MDVQLPDANGLYLIREIRAEGDAVKILVISAFAFNEDEETAKRLAQMVIYASPTILITLKML